MAVVLVTGASGLVGRHALAALRVAGHEVHGLSRRPPADAACTWHTGDVLDPAAVTPLLSALRPSHLLHLAWEIDEGRYWSSPDNVRWVEATLNLARQFAAAGGRRFVGAGTCAEYSWDAASAAGERLDERRSPRQARHVYGRAKNAVFDLLRDYCPAVGVEFAWGRLFFTYGAPDRRATVVTSVIRSLRLGEVARCTDGRQRRDYIHVRDAAGALVALLGGQVTGGVNVGSGVATPVAEVITSLGTLLGRPDLVHLGAVARPADDPDYVVADIRRLRDEVGFVPKTSLSEGLAETVAWWRSQPA